MNKLLLLALTLGGCVDALAQNPAANAKSPESFPDQKVAFRFRAPDAKNVELRGQWPNGSSSLIRGEGGIWSVTVDSVPAGVWEYSFVVDGLSVLDPMNPMLKPQRAPGKSILHIPATPPNPWDWQDIPHGSVHQHGYSSKAVGRPREVWIYTPPGYETAPGKKYPLLVLQHGSGDNQQTWVTHGKAHWILDSLIASKKAVPMIVMMIDGHPLGQLPRESPAERRKEAMDAFARELLEDAIPLVETLYPIESGSGNHAIAGLSMGGGQALSVGLANLDKFAWIGAFSAAPGNEDYIASAINAPEQTDQSLRLLWVAVGKDDFLRDRDQQFADLLTSKGIRHVWQVTEGDHSWPVWRRYLAEFVPLLFQKRAE